MINTKLKIVITGRIEAGGGKRGEQMTGAHCIIVLEQ
jgi:hypothetical protein